MINRRVFLKNLVLGVAGLYVPSTKLIFDMGAHTTLKLIDCREYHSVLEEIYGPLAAHLYTGPAETFSIPYSKVTQDQLDKWRWHYRKEDGHLTFEKIA